MRGTPRMNARADPGCPVRQHGRFWRAGCHTISCVGCRKTQISPRYRGVDGAVRGSSEKGKIVLLENGAVFARWHLQTVCA